MHLILDNFKPNGLAQEPVSTMSDRLINSPTYVNTGYLGDIEYIRPLLVYSEPWTVESDLFQHLTETSLNKLRNGRCILVFDASMEGFSPYQTPIAISLHHQCQKYNIDPRKIYLLTANFKENDCHNNYLALTTADVGINIVETTVIGDMVLPERYEDFDHHYNECKLHHSDKIFLQLSRRNRPHRVMANYLLSMTPAAHHALYSQDRLTDDDIPRLFYEYRKSTSACDEITERELNAWNDKFLPMTVDNTDFQVNWASWRSPELYNKTLFSVILETAQHDYGGTALFLSEKIFKPIIHRQPFVVFGHKGINTFLRSLGLRTYEQWFDVIDFDLETDPVMRYKKLLRQVNEIVKYLKSLSIQDRVKWRFLNREVLDHNYNLVVNGTITNREATKMHETIKSYFDGNFFSQVGLNFNKL